MRSSRNRRGGVLALVAIFLPVAFILAGFAINVAYMELSRTELRVATDAAARAGGRTLALTGDEDEARRVARRYARNNRVAGDPLRLDDSDLIFGQSTRDSLAGRYEFVAGKSPFNALNVLGRRSSGSLSGAVNLFMPGIMSVDRFEPIQSATATQVEMDLAVVLDRSGSMAYAADEASVGASTNPALAPAGWAFCDAVPPGSRWLDAVAGVNAFLRALTKTPQSERVALVTYSDKPTIDVPLSSDYSVSFFDRSMVGAIPTTLDDRSARFCGGTTNIGGAIRLAERALFDAAKSRPWAVKAIVVMTDGIHNTGTKPTRVAKSIGANGTMIYTITFSAEAAQADMKKVAEFGSGNHVHAETGAELVDAYKEIVRSLPTLLTD